MDNETKQKQEQEILEEERRRKERERLNDEAVMSAAMLCVMTCAACG